MARFESDMSVREPDMALRPTGIVTVYRAFLHPAHLALPTTPLPHGLVLNAATNLIDKSAVY